MNPLLSTAEDLSRLIESLEAEERLAVDTEADSLHCYFEKLCLIQISTEHGAHALVDPLAEMSIDPLLALFSRKTLIFHAADYDIRMLRAAGPFVSPDIFDTGVAARLLGFTELGLAAIARSLLGIEMAKGSQKEDWGRRPLPPRMIDYAINDTRHLHALEAILRERLVEAGRLAWFEESCRRVVDNAMQDRQRDPDEAWRISGWAKLSPRGAAILRAIWQWRDAAARERDRPPFHVLRNDELLRAAAAYDAGQPFDSPQLKGRQKARFAEAARAGATQPEDQWPERQQRPRPKRFTPEQDARLERLRTVRQKQAAELKLDPSVIAPRAVMERIAADPSNASELLGWQRQVLGIADWV